MKIREILKQAITNGDWQILCDTYQHLTGESISPPSIIKKEEPKFEDMEDDYEIDLIQQKQPTDQQQFKKHTTLKNVKVGRGKKSCPQCQTTVGARTKHCPKCKYSFYPSLEDQEPRANLPPVRPKGNLSETDDPFEEFRIDQKKNKLKKKGLERFAPPPSGQRRPNLFNREGLNELHADQKISLHPDNPALGVGKVRKRKPPPRKVKIKCSLCNVEFEEYANSLKGVTIETWKCDKCLNSMRPR